jgi:heat shock protein HslJ
MKTIFLAPLLALAACTTLPYGAPPPVPVEAPYRAIGTEPFWDLTIDRGGVMTFIDRGDGVAVTEPTPPVRIGFAGETFNGRRLKVNIVHAPCSDGMSDRSYPDTVNVSVDGRPYRGCGATADFFGSTNEYGQPTMPQGAFNLSNTNWRVVAINGRPVPVSGYYLNFLPDRVEGKFGCNNIGAGYSVAGDQLRAGALLMTRMACENDALEAQGTAVMAQPMTITQSGDRLTLGNAAGTIELTRAR